MKQNNKNRIVAQLLTSCMVVSLLLASFLGLSLNNFGQPEVSQAEYIIQHSETNQSYFSLPDILPQKLLFEVIEEDSEDDNENKKSKVGQQLAQFLLSKSIYQIDTLVFINKLDFNFFYDKAIYLKLCSLKIPS